MKRPKWKNLEIKGGSCIITLLDNTVIIGMLDNCFWSFGNGDHDTHKSKCEKLFGSEYTNEYDAKELSDILGITIGTGNCPTSSDPRRFLQLYYDKIAKINTNHVTPITIEDDFDIKPKFKL